MGRITRVLLTSVILVVGAGVAWAVTTANMNLTLPDVGVTAGPQYATDINAAITSIDAHDHTTGSGVKVPSAGININADLDMEPSGTEFGVLDAKYCALKEQASSPAQATSAWADTAGDLYWRDDGGNDVQITDGAGLSASTIGGFGGDYSSSTAVANYSDTTKTYTFLQDTLKTGSIVGGDVCWSEPGVTSAKTICMKSPTSLAADYSLTWPGALPASNKQLATYSSAGVLAFGPTLPADEQFVTIDASGNLATQSEKVITTHTVMADVDRCDATTAAGFTNQLAYVALDGATDEACVFSWVIPEDYDSATSLIVSISYTLLAAPGGGETVIWDLRGESFGDGESNGALNTIEAGLSQAVGSDAGNDVKRLAFSSVENADITGDLTAGDVMGLNINRDASADTFNSDVGLIAIDIQYTKTLF